MPLVAGSRLGAFQVLSTLGAGGMGEVYQARDTELGRDVALKILSPSFSHDADGLARFEREARILAALNHRNIAAIYGVASDGTTRALVLELIPGATLADLVARGPLPIAQALTIADQIAAALDAAHERSIVHRDLKPANIKITDEGTVKVLDFGIAKALVADSNQSTIESHHTRDGTILGTRSYMSPEQTRGLAVDKRADVWAFGCVLYEMLTGQRAFVAATAVDVTMAVLERDPDWTVLPQSTPEPVRRVLRRALTKDPRRRLRDIADARIELDDGLDQLSGASRAPSSVIHAPASWRVHAAWAAAVIAVLAIGVADRIGQWSESARDPVTHVAVPLPPMTTQLVPAIALSNDGRKLAIASLSGLMVRDLSAPGARLLQGTAGATTPFFSPDGNWIGFHADGRLRRVAVEGGEPITVADITGSQRGFSWAADDSIIFGHTNAPLFRIPPRGGEPAQVTTLDAANGETSHRWPHVLPGGGVVLYAAGPSVTANEWNTAHVVAQSLETGERKVLAPRGSMPAYSDGYVFYLSGRSLLAQRFDPDRLAVSGPVQTVLPDVSRMGNGAAWYAVSAAGSLAVVRAAPPSPRKLVWFDRHGVVTPLPVPPAFYGAPRLSPDGSRVAVSVSDPDTDIWVYDVARGTSTRITSDGKSLWPMWTPDGTRVVYSSTRGGPSGLRSRRADATGDDELIVSNTFINRANTWSTAGELVLTQVGETDTADLWKVRPPEPPRRYFASQRDQSDARLSPDQRWLAYRSTESGRSQIYITRFQEPIGERLQVTSLGGTMVAWSHDSRELFIRNDNELWSVAVAAETGPVGEPKRLFAANVAIADAYFDVTRDARFVMVIDDQPAPAPTELQLTFNIGDDLRRRVGTTR